MKPNSSVPDFARHLVNLASTRLGAKALSCSDDFFAPMERMLQDSEPVFIDGKYDDHGKWMDGWESRRRRGGGYDHAVIQLGTRGLIRGLDIDTRFFTGNYPPEASLEAADASASESAEDLNWREILPRTNLQGDRHHYLPITDDLPATHVRLNIYPDGGVARLRVFGEPLPDASRLKSGEVVELSSISNGGRIAGFNDAHYGNPWVILLEGRGINMGDGWETRRRREPGNDWILVRLGLAGIVERIEVDTAHFKGNYPDQCSVQGALIQDQGDEALVEIAQTWPELLPPQKLEMDHQHFFASDALNPIGVVNCLRLNIFPDGGVSRFRVFGKPQR